MLLFLRKRFFQAFGEPLLNSRGWGKCNETSDKELWRRTVALRGERYSLPDGNVGFVLSICYRSEETEKCTYGRQNSEVEFIFTAVILQRDKMVRSSKDIRRTLTRRLDMWEAGQRSELVHEAERCDRQFFASHLPMTYEHVERVFNRLMLKGIARSAVRFLTERSGGGGGSLDLSSDAQGKNGATGKSVFDVLKEKCGAESSRF